MAYAQLPSSPVSGSQRIAGVLPEQVAQRGLAQRDLTCSQELSMIIDRNGFGRTPSASQKCPNSATLTLEVFCSRTTARNDTHRRPRPWEIKSIDDSTAAALKAITVVEKHLHGRAFLVGESLTHADLYVASNLLGILKQRIDQVLL